MENLKEVSLKIYETLFSMDESVKIDGEEHFVDTTRTGLRCVRTAGYLFIEQNPEKDSQWARKVQEGHQIMWVMKGRRYVARVMDGIYLSLKKGKPL
ncbi:MAG: hypothetical protein AYK19_14780 [Theionarchaea archaeon DG-70-1]|nr:MAG: hypothetical protein AYK19_14780 [Theionarchaea archaeon DG-70-1]